VQEIANFTCVQTAGDGCVQPFQTNLEFTKIKLSNIDSIIELGQGFPPFSFLF